MMPSRSVESPLSNVRDGKWFAPITLLSYVMCAVGAATLLITLLVTIRSYSPVWMSDQWAFGLELATNGGHYPLHLLWAQHNEHRIPILKIFSLADIYFFSGRNLSLYAWNWVMQLTMFGLSIYAIRRLGNLSSWQFRTLVGFLAFCEFNPNQLENFTWGFQSAFFMAFFFSFLAICCLAFYAERVEQRTTHNRSVLLWLCVAAAFLAECNLASGLILWAILPFCVLMLGLPRALLRPLLFFGVLSIGLYLIGYQSPGHHTHPSDALRRPFQVLKYIQTYLGASWDNVSRGWGMFLSLLAISFVAVAWSYGVLRHRHRQHLYVVSLSMAMLCLLAAAMTALGRLNFGYSQAASSRYQTPAMLFWCFGAIAAVTFSSDSPRNRSAFVVLQLTCIAFFVFQARSYASILAAYDATTFNRNVAGLALEAGTDPQKILNLYPLPGPIDWYRFVSRNHIIPPPFPEYSHVGASLRSVYEVTPTTMCQGFIDGVQPVAGDSSASFSASGWASVHSVLTRKSVIILVGNNDRIAGIGITGAPRPDIVSAGLLPESQLDSGWFGYAKFNPSETTARAYEELSGRKVCPLSGEVKIPR
ncbi:MAG: hypothetical protein WAM39_07625 [Bryobacteraceae bacterium]